MVVSLHGVLNSEWKEAWVKAVAGICEELQAAMTKVRRKLGFMRLKTFAHWLYKDMSMMVDTSREAGVMAKMPSRGRPSKWVHHTETKACHQGKRTAVPLPGTKAQHLSGTAPVVTEDREEATFA